MLSATLLPSRTMSLSPTTVTTKPATLTASLIPATCPAGTSQGAGLVCPEGHIKSGFTAQGVCCKRVYTSVTEVPAPVTRPPSATMGPSQVPTGPSQVPVGPAQAGTGPATEPSQELLPPTFAPESPYRPWLKPLLIGGGVLAAVGITIAVVRR